MVGMFFLWVPTLFLMRSLTKDFKRKDMWKAALRGCPRWMRIGMWILVALALVLFGLPVSVRHDAGGTDPTYVLFPLALYGISFCLMYSVIHAGGFDSSRRCLNGHRISPLAKFCEECGAKSASDGNVAAV